MNPKFVVCLFFLLINSNIIFGQESRFGLTLNSGFAIYNLKLNPQEEIKQSVSPIVNVGLKYNIRYSDKFSTEIDLGINFTKRSYEYKKVYLSTNQVPQVVIRESILIKNHNATYLNGSANLGYKLKNVKLKIGVQAISFTQIKDTKSYRLQTNENGSYSVPYDSGRQENLVYLFLELQTGIGFFITKENEISFNYNWGFGNRSHRSFAPKQRISFGLTKYF